MPLVVHRVNARHAQGDSPEDAARRARYEAFAAMAGSAEPAGAIKSIVLGHHADDQVETLLLALSNVCSGQEFRGAILGKVTDPSGAVLPAAIVSVVNDPL